MDQKNLQQKTDALQGSNQLFLILEQQTDLTRFHKIDNSA